MKNKENTKLFILFFGFMILAFVMVGLGNDYYWHVKAGEYMVKNLTIPFYDVFSWYGIQQNLYWMSHEWLSEIVIYGFRFIFKDAGPYVFCFIFQSLITFFIYNFNKNVFIKNKLAAIGWAVVGFLTFSRVMLPRPHMISYLLLIFTIYLLFDAYRNVESKKIYFLPLVSILWANFHGGSSNLPYILCIIFIVGGLFNFKIGKIVGTKLKWVQIRRLLIVTVLCVLAVNINPHGFKMLTYPYVNMQDKYMQETILEWAQPNLNDTSTYTAFVLIGVAIIVMIVTNKKIMFIDFILMGAFLFLGLKSLKFIPLLYIVSSFIIPGLFEEDNVPLDKKYMLVFCISLLVLSVAITTVSVSRNIANKKPIPDEIIEYIKNKKPKRLFNHYNYGGYLIYNDIPVFIDGRADMYSKYNYKNGVDLGLYGYDYLLNFYDFDMLVFMTGIRLQTTLDNNPNYVLTKLVDGTVVYEKKAIN